MQVKTYGLLFNADSGADGSPEAPPEQGDDKTLTQEKVNALVGQARKEARRVAESELLQTLGVASLAEATQKLALEKKREQDELSEAEKLKQQLDQATADLAVKDKAIADNASAIKLAKRDSAVQNALRDANVRKEDADDAFYLMDKRGLLTDDMLAEDGTINTKAIQTAVDKFKKDKAAYFAPTGAGIPSNRDGRASAPTEKEAEKAGRGQRNTMRGW